MWSDRVGQDYAALRCEQVSNSEEAGERQRFLVHFRAMALLVAVRGPEGKTLEFKRDLSSPDGLLRTVVACANTAGGTVLVGVEDGTRHVRGIADPLAVEERLASLISDSVAIGRAHV